MEVSRLSKDSCGDGSVGEVLAVQAQKTDFDPPEAKLKARHGGMWLEFQY